MGKASRRRRRPAVTVIETKRRNAVASTRRLETASVCWTDNQLIVIPRGMSNATIRDYHTKCCGYCVYDHQDLLEHFHVGEGRPFATACLGCRMCDGPCVDFGLNPVHVSVDVPEDLRPSDTPVLGICCCVTCLGCVHRMPALDGKWRPCAACGNPCSHEAFHLMFPVTLDGIKANTAKAKKKHMETMVEKNKAGK